MILFGYGCKQMNSINELVVATNEIGNAKWGQNAQNLLVDNNGSQIEELQLRAYKITYFFTEEKMYWIWNVHQINKSNIKPFTFSLKIFVQKNLVFKFETFFNRKLTRFFNRATK